MPVPERRYAVLVRSFLRVPKYARCYGTGQQILLLLGCLMAKYRYLFCCSLVGSVTKLRGGVDPLEINLL